MATTRRLIVNVQRRPTCEATARRVEEHTRKIVSKMFSTRMANTMRITIKIRAGVKRNTLGSCHWRDESKSTKARSKHHTIILKRDTGISQMLRTLTHELKHAHQMATGRLVWKWRGGAGSKVGGYCWRPVGHTGAAVFTAVKDFPCWHLRPWEIEAVEAEVRFHGHNGRSFDMLN